MPREQEDLKEVLDAAKRLIEAQDGDLEATCEALEALEAAIHRLEGK